MPLFTIYVGGCLSMLQKTGEETVKNSGGAVKFREGGQSDGGRWGGGRGGVGWRGFGGGGDGKGATTEICRCGLGADNEFGLSDGGLP